MDSQNSQESISAASQAMTPRRKLTPKQSYDSKCLELAEHFAQGWKPQGAPDEEGRKLLCSDLAKRIQQAIEDFEDELGIDR